jgi:hypothetical protein
MAEERNFSRTVSVRFRLDHVNGDEEHFTGVSGLPALKLIEFAQLMEELDEVKTSGSPELFTALVELTLEDESAARFIARMSDKADPIGLTQIMDLMPWLMEQYGMRPTKPSEDSSAISTNPDGGTNSTAAAPEQVSTHSPSLQTVS